MIFEVTGAGVVLQRMLQRSFTSIAEYARLSACGISSFNKIVPRLRATIGRSPIWIREVGVPRLYLLPIWRPLPPKLECACISAIEEHVVEASFEPACSGVGRALTRSLPGTRSDLV